MDTFGVTLKMLRCSMRLSQAAVAKRLQVSRPRVSALETGRRRAPSHQQIQQLALALGLSRDEAQRLEFAGWLDRASREAPVGLAADLCRLLDRYLVETSGAYPGGRPQPALPRSKSGRNRLAPLSTVEETAV
jgi:transcriptional regulator with XRE-family HTH domain